MGLDKMITNTANNEQNSWHLPLLYGQIDPKYRYVDYQNWLNGRYHWNPKSDSVTPGSGNEFDYLMRQRHDLIDSKIHLLQEELHQRYRLKDENIYRINLDQCAFKTLIYALGEEIFDRRRIELERKIIDLEQEKRREETSYFRDVLFIRKEFRDSLIEKLEEQQKETLFVDQEEVLP